MKLGSLFDGSGGFPLAGVMNGITPAWAAEIEPYPIAVTRSRFPGMKHYGNVCDINGAEIEPVDIVTAGSPCQDMSVAGLRAGIYEGKRSNLFFESIRIVKEMRAATNGKQPRFFVWENVPGAFSSDKGGAFQAVLQAVCSVADDTVSIPQPKSNDGTDRVVWLNAGCIVGNGYSVAWRTLDAQYWGVPQRRARIYLVADFDSERADQILFKPESLRGDMQQGDAAREEAAADALGGTNGGDGAAGVVSKGNGECFLTPERHMSLTVGGGQAGQGYPCVMYPTIARTLEARYDSSPCIDRGQNIIALQANGIDRAEEVYTIHDQATRFAGKRGDYTDGKGNGLGIGCGAMNTLTNGDRHAVCYDARGNRYYTRQRSDEFAECDVASCHSARKYKDATDLIVAQGKPPRRYIIRRLMPVECARLQGFPDRWGELAPYDGDDAFWEGVRKTHAEINGKAYKPTKNIKGRYDKLHNDGAEYKMWGNGIALPCAEYVIRMIKEEV